jgi:very-short-patch-repair endonuclease
MPRLRRPQTFRARALRRSSTPAETALWTLLRNRSLGAKFRRQQPLGPFIVDFLCADAGLVVEADGGYHDAIADQDAARDEWLYAAGFTVLRLTNEEILEHPERALLRICEMLRAAPRWWTAPQPQRRLPTT